MGRNSRIASAESWIDARTRHHLTDAQVQMARELGMNPKKLGKLDTHRQQPWKLPLPRYIEELAQLGYRGVPADDLVQMRIFGVTPDFIRSVERRGMGRPPIAELVQMRITGRRRLTR